jgi:hypothetical protein
MENRTKSLGYFVTEELFALILTVCSDRGEDISDFLRRSIWKELAYISFFPEPVNKSSESPSRILQGGTSRVREPQKFNNFDLLELIAILEESENWEEVSKKILIDPVAQGLAGN